MVYIRNYKNVSELNADKLKSYIKYIVYIINSDISTLQYWTQPAYVAPIEIE